MWCRRRRWHPTPVLLPRKSQVGCSPWGCEELDTTEQLHFHFSLSCIGEGNGYPLQCSCLENPRDGGAWWAAIYGVAQSRTRLKRLSSSSSRCFHYHGDNVDVFWSESYSSEESHKAPPGTVPTLRLLLLVYMISGAFTFVSDMNLFLLCLLGVTNFSYPHHTYDWIWA